MRQKIINLYNKELELLTSDPSKKDKVNAMKNMIKFLKTCSNKELNKLPSMILKFTKNNFISSDELAFIQTRYYNLIKYNSIKNAKTSESNKSYIFGFIEETKKGYCIFKGREVHTNNSTYENTNESNNFLSKIVLILKEYAENNSIKENNNKLIKHSNRIKQETSSINLILYH